MIHVIGSIVGINSVIGVPVILFTDTGSCEIIRFQGGSIFVEFASSSHPRIDKKGNKVTFSFVEKREYTKFLNVPTNL